MYRVDLDPRTFVEFATPPPCASVPGRCRTVGASTVTMASLIKGKIKKAEQDMFYVRLFFIFLFIIIAMLIVPESVFSVHNQFVELDFCKLHLNLLDSAPV